MHYMEINMINFKSGQIVNTMGINVSTKDNKTFQDELVTCLARHLQGDWGEVCKGDEGINDQALIDGDSLMSVYSTTEGKIWIITEWDRSSTTILFPSEY